MGSNLKILFEQSRELDTNNLTIFLYVFDIINIYKQIGGNMNLEKMSEKISSKMKWYDYGIFKLSIFFFTLFLFTAWEGFRMFVMGFDWYWYLILTIICAIPIIKKEFE